MEQNKRRIAALLQRMPWVGYAIQRIWRIWQPWVTVGAVGTIFNDDGQMLIVEHVYHPKYPWGLPGGWTARNENPDETVRREVYEETGLRITVLKPLLILQARSLPRHLDIAYLCHAPHDTGEIRLSAELLSYQWIDPAVHPPMGLFSTQAVEVAVAERASAERASAEQASVERADAERRSVHSTP